MNGRTYNNESYRFAWNGKEKEDEIFEGCLAFEARIYDSRIARWMSTDPREGEYAWQSTYVYFKNSPLSQLDYLGMGDGDPEPSENDKSLKEKFLDLIVYQKEPKKPELTIEEFENANPKPNRCDYNDRGDYKAAKKNYKKEKRKLEDDWDNYKFQLVNYNAFKGAVESFANSKNKVIVELMGEVVKRDEALLLGTLEHNELRPDGTLYDRWDKDGEKGFYVKTKFGSTVLIDLFIFNATGLYVQTEATKSYDEDVRHQKFPPTLASFNSVMVHELAHYLYMATLKNSSDYDKSDSEKFAQEYERKFYENE